jgi:hypothetical protein
LNFKEGEVRERDYFFVVNFHLFAIWIGIGATALIQWVDELMTRPMEPAGAPARASVLPSPGGRTGGRPHAAVIADVRAADLHVDDAVMGGPGE